MAPRRATVSVCGWIFITHAVRTPAFRRAASEELWKMPAGKARELYQPPGMGGIPTGKNNATAGGFHLFNASEAQTPPRSVFKAWLRGRGLHRAASLWCYRQQTEPLPTIPLDVPQMEQPEGLAAWRDAGCDNCRPHKLV